MPKHIVLYLNENPLDAVFTVSSIAGKELRLRAAIPNVSAVHVLTFPGLPPINLASNLTTDIEKKIHLHVLPPCPHYFKTIPLVVFGLYYAFKFKPTTIEAESPLFSGIAAVIIGKITHLKTLVEVRTTFLSLINLRLPFVPYDIKFWLVNSIQQLSLRHATAVIVNSRFYYHWLKTIGIDSTIINPGIQNLDLKRLALKQLPPIFTFGYFGRLVTDKGPHIFLKALKILAMSPSIPPFRAVIIGHGPLLPSLMETAEKNGLGSHLRFLRPVKAIEAFTRFHVLVNPCLVDAPLEMVNAEAAACRIPVIAFGRNHCPETVIANQSGLLSKEKTAKALANMMRQLLINPALYRQLCEGGKILASHYRFDTQVKKLLELYRRIIFQT